MPTFANWLSRDHESKAAFRAAAAWQRIQDNPTSIVIMRGSSNLTAQTVRIEMILQVQESTGGAGMAAVQRLTVFGVASHPTVTATNIAKGDRFVLDSVNEYRVIDTFAYPGEIQATCERVR